MISRIKTISVLTVSLLLLSSSAAWSGDKASETFKQPEAGSAQAQGALKAGKAHGEEVYRASEGGRQKSTGDVEVDAARSEFTPSTGGEAKPSSDAAAGSVPRQ